jgi:hypothetical protein
MVTAFQHIELVQETKRLQLHIKWVMGKFSSLSNNSIRSRREEI